MLRGLVVIVLRSQKDNPMKYKNLNDGDLLQMLGDDGLKWAEAFQEIIVDEGKPIDVALMTGWFANAIEHSSAVRNWRVPHNG